MLSFSKLCGGLLVPVLVAMVVAGCGSSSGSSGGSASAGGSGGPPQGTVSRAADFGIGAPDTSRWDEGGHDAFIKAAGIIGAKPTWLSNIAFDQSPQLIDRLVRSGNKVIMSNGAGYADAMIDAAQKYPDNWFWIYSALSSTKGLKNVVGIDLHWNEIGYLAAAIACKARTSPSQKIALIIAEPIPAYTHAAGGVADGAKAGCGSDAKLISTWTGTFDDNAKTKQATEAAIAQGASVVLDFQDAATPGVQAALKAHPNVKYVATEFDYHSDIPKQIVTSVAVDYDEGYLGAARRFKAKTLKATVYPSGVASGGIKLTKFYNSPPAVQQYGQALYDKIKSGKVQVDLNRQVKK